MYIIAGLGNPGGKYKRTRHNMGFECIDRLAADHDIKIKDKRLRSLVGEGFINGKKVLLMKPQTYMNLSGDAVGEAVRYYRIDPDSQLIVLCDDISIDLGSIRIRLKGSAGGHNGLKSIIAALGTEGFTRVRMGVGDTYKEGGLAEHVLGHLKMSERRLAAEAFENAVRAVELIIDGSPDKAMNEFNRKREPKA